MTALIRAEDLIPSRLQVVPQRLRQGGGYVYFALTGR